MERTGIERRRNRLRDGRTEVWTEGGTRRMERRRNGETEGWREGEMESLRDGGKEKQGDSAMLFAFSSKINDYTPIAIQDTSNLGCKPDVINRVAKF